MTDVLSDWAGADAEMTKAYQSSIQPASEPTSTGKILAVINSATAVGDAGNYQWKYTCDKAEKTGAGYGVTTAITGDDAVQYTECFNWREDRNADVTANGGTYGDGVRKVDIEDSTIDGALGPVPVNTPVKLEPKPVTVSGVTTMEYWFSAPNEVQAPCAS